MSWVIFILLGLLAEYAADATRDVLESGNGKHNILLKLKQPVLSNSIIPYIIAPLLGSASVKLGLSMTRNYRKLQVTIHLEDQENGAQSVQHSQLRAGSAFAAYPPPKQTKVLFHLPKSLRISCLMLPSEQ